MVSFGNRVIGFFCSFRFYSPFVYSAPFVSASSDEAFFFLLFLLSRKLFVNRVFNSSSSSSFSVLTSSGLYQRGGWVIIEGPLGRSAIVKWNAATKVFEGV
ncbi:hypothetical protein K435DRAFT_330788 [Dendrothele bispora CBS 962.96]|uniref:Uncharacterized protein n=1 Tax=Dendrothele bispora (strain CBS 962.96) TaxID=1314807 RepID=A0A4V4HIP3_DENBC|nr:hypothetical protein K435DRAFT_330788 [Dendrothele bispora CBS 962.96]